MGETSAKQLRGGEMDAVIFGGTSTRSSRNVAEVLIHLDNSDRTAPSAFNEFDELEVSRRIEREKGSVYRVNGREVRARDVQILFADQATGPRSTALVSQGKISAIISAKPENRRGLLEEAAGITGLHSRRHEAELRLRGAETNLERLDDILATLEERHGSLKKQARQAKRYRGISDQIRKAEAIVLYHRWTDARRAVDVASQQLVETERQVGEFTSRVATATTKREAAAEAIPPLRDNEVAAAAEVQHLTLSQRELDAEEQRVASRRDACQQRLDQIGADLAREQNLAHDATEALTRLTAEAQGIDAQSGDDAGHAEELANKVAGAAAHAEHCQADSTRLTEQVAAGQARRDALQQEMSRLESRANQLRAQFEQVSGELAEARAAAGADDAHARGEQALAAAQSTLAAARATLERAEQNRTRADDAVNAARDARHQAAEERARIRAEIDALSKLLADQPDGEWQPIVDNVQVDPGYETALGAALGSDLDAAVDTAAPRHWRADDPANVKPAPLLPADVTALTDFVRGAPALTARLRQIGVVADAETGDRLSVTLAVGQRLVSQNGDLWRWDGFTVRSAAPAPAAVRLEQRNRLAALAAPLETCEQQFNAAEAKLAEAQSAAAAATQAGRDARDAQRQAEATVAQAQREHNELTRAQAAAASRIQTLSDRAQTLESELTDVTGRLSAAAQEVAGLDNLADQRDQATAAREALTQANQQLRAAQSAHDQWQQQAEARRNRLAAIAGERQSWEQRQAGATNQTTELQQRQAAETAELQQLSARPEAIATERNRVLDALTAASAKRESAAHALAAAESSLNLADKALRSDEAALAEAREHRVRVEASVSQCEQTLASVRDRIAERLECRPDQLFALTEADDPEKLPPLDAADRRLERLLRERDNMGPVNLRAEQEADELDEQIVTMQSERADLVAAIGRLRQGIASLNKEARQRLTESFTIVNQHFSELFVKLFGGGRAHLAFTESEDPLDAGLEIFASPPGKALQALSLLSGGEQALTAIALIFAVFQTNPAPICVLDEVDAPLDDANVHRFCSLLEEMATAGRTRFLLITHHRMTMARMDRLYGVTMPERGISQLVSVDLHRAEELRKTA